MNICGIVFHLSPSYHLTRMLKCLAGLTIGAQS